jgi:hypothetical protein
MIGQIVGGQIGGRSIEFSHSGCIAPLTHWQVHPASAELAENHIAVSNSINAAAARNIILPSRPSSE